MLADGRSYSAASESPGLFLCPWNSLCLRRLGRDLVCLFFFPGPNYGGRLTKHLFNETWRQGRGQDRSLVMLFHFEAIEELPHIRVGSTCCTVFGCMKDIQERIRLFADPPRVFFCVRKC